MFEGLPDKFIGSCNSGQDVSTWVNKFRLVSDIKSWDKSKQLKILELWLDGQAYEWFKKFKNRLPDADIEASLTSLINEFNRVKIGTLRDLLEMNPIKGKSISSFNSRFVEIWNTIPINYYTEKIGKETYLLKVLGIDREVWWKLAQIADSKTPRSLIEEADMYYLIKLKYDN
ncbi:hypothetical protein BB561_001893 [Smittium simulii]|uniref:Ty3 transposon capsid-like protein domain-containing protein n=1 Tax=Smittium simulii TaxID=133385 RepID=A0A2T9YSS3_9FUNG|nr:hypothetical protein BB561_001893 [Smittium simulii]